MSGNMQDRDGLHEGLKYHTDSIKTHHQQPLQLFSEHHRLRARIFLISQHVRERVTSQQSVSFPLEGNAM